MAGNLEHFLFLHILGIIIPNDSYFSEGWLNHQPDNIVKVCMIWGIDANQKVLGDDLGIVYRYEREKKTRSIVVHTGCI